MTFSNEVVTIAGLIIAVVALLIASVSYPEINKRLEPFLMLMVVFGFGLVLFGVASETMGLNTSPTIQTRDPPK